MMREGEFYNMNTSNNEPNSFFAATSNRQLENNNSQFLSQPRLLESLDKLTHGNVVLDNQQIENNMVSSPLFKLHEAELSQEEIGENSQEIISMKKININMNNNNMSHQQDINPLDSAGKQVKFLIDSKEKLRGNT